MTKYIGSDLTEKIKATTEDVQNAVEDKYPDASVVLDYFNSVPKSRPEQVGDIFLNRLDKSTPGMMPCDGRLLQKSQYPELAEILKDKTQTSFQFNNLDAIAGSSSVNAEVLSISERSNGELVVLYSASPYIRVFTGFNGTDLNVPSLPGIGRGGAFSPDESIFIAVHSGSPFMTVYETENWTKLTGTPTLPLTGYNVSFNPDGSKVAIGHAGSARRMSVYLTDSWTLDPDAPIVTAGTTGWCAEFSPNGKYLVVGFAGSPYSALYDAETWELKSEYTPPNVGFAVYTAKFSNDSNVLYLGSNSGTREVLTRHLKNGDRQVTGSSDEVYSISIHPNGEGFSYGTNSAPFTATRLSYMKVYELSSLTQSFDGPALPDSANINWVKAVTVSKDGNYLYYGLSNTATGPFFGRITLYTPPPIGTFALPRLPAVRYGDILVQPMIRVEPI